MNGLLSLLLLVAPVSAQDAPAAVAPAPPSVPEATYELPRFDCGLVTRYSGHRIGDGCLQAADNVLIDQDGSVYRRPGYNKFNTVALSTPTAIRRLYPFDATDNTRYVVAISSDKHWRAGTDGSFAVITGLTGQSPTANTDCVQALGRQWCTNRTNGLTSWDGSSTAAVAGAPLGGLIDSFRNRILVADVVGAQSSLYGSGDIDGTNWTTASKSTSPFILRIGGVNDAEAVRCLMGTHNDTYLIGTENRLYGLYGFDNDEFVIREISREVGCLDDTSVQHMDGAVIWLSKRGMERMRGPTIDWRFSDPVLDILEPIIAASGNSRSETDTTQADFQSGNLTASGAGAPMSATIVPHSVTPTTFSAVNTSSSDWVNWTLDAQLSTTTFVGGVTISTAPYLFLNGDLENGTTSGFTISSRAVDNVFVIGTNVTHGSYSLLAKPYCDSGYFGQRYMRVYIFNTAGSTLTYSDAEAAGNRIISLADYSTQTLRAKFEAYAGSTTPVQLWTPEFLTMQGGNLRFFNGAINATCSGASGYGFAELDEVRVERPFSITMSSHAYAMTRTFDTGVSTPIGGPLAVSSSTGSGDLLTFRIRSATSSSGDWNAYVTYAPGDTVTQTRRFWNVLSSFTVTVASAVVSTAPPVLESLELSATTTGYFISQCRNPGTSISSWGLFQCSTNPDGGSFTFEVSTGASCHAVTRDTAPWTAQTNNTLITIATAPFIAYRPLFTTSGPSQEPALQDCTINWNEGGDRPDVASAVYDHRYHLFYTTSTASSPRNLNALVLDQYDRWTAWDNIPATAATIFNRQLLIGDGADTGQVRRLYTGHNDDGSDFTSRVRTRDSDLGDWMRLKQFGDLRLELSPEANTGDNVALTVRAYIDLVHLYELGTINLNEDTGLLAAAVPWPAATQASGRYLSIEFTNTGAKPWTFYRGALRYRPLREE